MPNSQDTTRRLEARKKPEQLLVGGTITVSTLPTELWRIIIRMAAYFPLDFHSTSGVTWDTTTAFNFKQIMATKFALLTVSRHFNAIVSEFLFELVYISTMHLSMSISSQQEWDRNRTWRHGGWRKAMTKLNLGYSPVPRPTNATDLSRRANVNIRYLFMEGNSGSHPSGYNVSLANFLKSECCSNLVGLFVAGNWKDWVFTPTTIGAIPSGLRILSWNAPAEIRELSVLLARLSSSLERLRIWWFPWANGITFPKMTHYAQVGGWYFHETLGQGEWKMPSLTHFTLGRGRSDELRNVSYPNCPTILDDIEYLQLHLRSQHSAQIVIEPTTIAAPDPLLRSLILVCDDPSDSLEHSPTLALRVLPFCNGRRFPKLKAVDVFSASLWRASVEEIQCLFLNLSYSLARPGVEVRIMS